MKKILLLLALMSICILSASAKSLVITLKNGTNVYFLITADKSPVMKFNDGGITMVDGASYTFAEVKSFDISNTDDPNAIDEASDDAKISYRANTILFAGDVNKVKVYNASGVQVEANVSKAGDRVAIDLNDLTKGVYVINTGDTSFKVIKK